MKNQCAVNKLKKIYSFAKLKPDSIAVVDYAGTRSTTYFDFIETINSYAFYLKKKNIKKGDVVAIMLDKCMEHYAIRFACNFIGAVFLSLDTRYPKNRIDTIVKDSNTKYIFTSEDLKKIKVTKLDCQIDESVYDDEDGYIVYTSGTTHTPKGILHDRTFYEIYENANMYQYIDSKIDKFIHASISNETFVLALADMIHLFYGDTVHLITNDILIDINKLKQYFIDKKINCTYTIPSLLRFIISSPYLRLAFIAGENTSLDFSKYKCQVYNAYGASESPLMSCSNVKKGIVVGDFIKNSKIWLSSYPKGNICYSGPGIMKKYINNEKLTEKIVEKKEDGSKIFYSQDVGLQVENGIKIIGRNDSVIKLSGKRVDVCEVETNLSDIDLIMEVAVKPFSEESSKYLCAFYTTLNMQQLDNDYIVRNLSKNLPEYMIPKKFIHKKFFERNINGKIDRTKLLDENHKIKKIDNTQTDNEKVLCDILRDITHEETIDINSSLAKIGLNSLGVLDFQVKIYNHFKVKLSVEFLSDSKSIRDIAKFLENSDISTATSYDLEKLYSLSESQMNLYLDIVANNKISTEYNNPFLIIIKGDYSFKKINQSIKSIIKKHPVLRSRIKIENALPFLSFDAKCQVTLEQKDPKKEFVKVFNIYKFLSRFSAYQEENSWKIYIDIHHLISDGTSLNTICNEFLNLLNGNIKDDDYLLDIDYGILDDINAKKNKNENDDKYIEEILVNLDDVRPLQKSVTNTSHNKMFFTINEDKHIIEKYLHNHNISPTNFFASCFAYLMACFSNSDYAGFCIVSSGRNKTANFDSVGMYVKTLPVVIACIDDNIDDFFSKSNDIINRAFEINSINFRLLNKNKFINSAVLFQYRHDLLNIKIGDEYLEFYELEHEPVSNLSVIVFNKDDNYIVEVEHANDYSDEFCEKFISTYNKIISQIIHVKNLSEIDLCDEDDLTKFNKINQTQKQIINNDIFCLYNKTLRKYPKNKVVCYRDISYTYEQAAYYVNEFRKTLTISGIDEGDKVAIFVERSHLYLLTSLAVLSIGAIYVPIDNNYPDKYIMYLLNNTNSSSVICSKETNKRVKKIADKLNNNLKIINAEELEIKKFADSKIEYCKNKDNQDACILFTSGSTGQPKGVVITKLGILNLAEGFANEAQMCHTDIFALYASFGFDVCLEVFYSSIFTGATIDIIEDSIKFDLYQLREYIDNRKITFLDLPSAFLKLFITDYKPKTLKVLIAGGEYLGSVNANYNYKLCDSYGPTEATVINTFIETKNKIHVSSVGFLLQNTKAYILDKNLRRLPYGSVGELYLSGLQVANGYYNNEVETSSHFLKNIFDFEESGYEVLYKTGDEARFLPDGSIGFVGRKDNQQKLRGNRIETSDIECCIRELDNVIDAFVDIVKLNTKENLVAYVVENDNLPVDRLQEVVKQHVKNCKPSYIVPSYVLKIDKIPLNINGKVDTNKLPSIRYSFKDIKTAKTNLEKSMIKCVSEVLNIPAKNIGVNSNFEDLGGSSLLAFSLSMLYKDKLDINLSAYDILNNQSIEEQINLINSSNKYKEIYILNKEDNEKKNLFFIHPGQGGSESYIAFSKHFNRQCNFVAVENYNMYFPNKRIKGIKNIAKKYADIIKNFQNEGPYYLGGWSYGGNIALEISKIFIDGGLNVDRLFLLDSFCINYNISKNKVDKYINKLNEILYSNKEIVSEIFNINLANNLMAEQYFNSLIYSAEDLLLYEPSKIPISTILFKANNDILLNNIAKNNLSQKIFSNALDLIKDDNNYGKYVNDLTLVNINTDHFHMLNSNYGKTIANKIIQCLN